MRVPFHSFVLFLQRAKLLSAAHIKAGQTMEGLLEKDSFIIEDHLQAFLEDGEDRCGFLLYDGMFALRLLELPMSRFQRRKKAETPLIRIVKIILEGLGRIL
jgi:hypothetical protein